jgi:hypothetical protein
MKITRRQLRDIIREAIDPDEWREFYKPSYENVQALSKRLRGDFDQILDALYNRAGDSMGGGNHLPAIDQLDNHDEMRHLAQRLLEKITKGNPLELILRNLQSGHYDDEIEDLARPLEDKPGDKYGPETTAVSLEDWKQMIVDNLKNSDTNIDEIEDLPGDYDYDNLWRNDADAADVARDIYADHASNIHDTYSDR